jgi:NAD(P)-dependent dehydrogenase (short-subunit alcohol dehydrogenase family)
VIQEALSRFGRIDTLINNAGKFVPNEFTKYSDQQHHELISTNPNGFFYITQLAVDEMVRQGSGHVVQITTTLVEHDVKVMPLPVTRTWPVRCNKCGKPASSAIRTIDHRSRAAPTNWAEGTSRAERDEESRRHCGIYSRRVSIHAWPRPKIGLP